MFEIRFAEEGTILLVGRFDAAQKERARELLSAVVTSAVVDCRDLAYISSAGLGVLLGLQKRLMDSGHRLKLVNLNPHIRELFRLAMFDTIFEID
jgi:anti-sigma B factor antagonist